jgi:hypothetical protein
MYIPYDRFLGSLLFQASLQCSCIVRPQQNKPIEVKTIQYIQQLIHTYDQGVM